MVKYHPDARFLTDYSAGSLPRSQALCVSAHLHYCQSCRSKISELTELGAELFVQQAGATLAPQAFERLLSRLQQTPLTSARSTGARKSAAALPHAIAKLTRGNLDNLAWRRIGKHFRYSPLKVGEPTRETSLLHISAGGSVPQHRHRGDEITVILKGSFSDNEDRYSRGDFIVRTSGETHRPVASQDEDCLCLVTLDAPILLSNWLYRLLVPLAERFLNRTA